MQKQLATELLKNCVGSSFCTPHMNKYAVVAAMMLLKDTFRDRDREATGLTKPTAVQYL